MKLIVTGEADFMLGTTREEVFEIVIQPPDGSFKFTQQVRKQPPHYAVVKEYVDDEDTQRSKVTDLVLDYAGAPAR